MTFKRPLIVWMSNFLTLATAIASEPVCPDGKEAFLADKNMPFCRDSAKVENGLGTPLHLFDIRKNKNEQNVLVVFTHANSDCKFPASNDSKDNIDFYWRMNEGNPNQCRKESSARAIIKNQIPVQSVSADRTHMTVLLTDLDKVKNDLTDKTVEVSLIKSGDGTCSASVTFISGKSDGQKPISLSCFYGEPTHLFGMNAYTLYGTNTEDKTPYKRRYAN